MPDDSKLPTGYLPRLAPEFYQGGAVVFWTHTIKDRAQGWCTSAFHAAFREFMLHAAARESLFCPIYVLMPDHVHLVWMGMATETDQRRATVFLRTQLDRLLKAGGFVLQHQAHDHVLRDEERKRGAFVSTCAYIAANPERAGLVRESAGERWPYLGCVVPGYPDLDVRAENFWEKFWRIYHRVRGDEIA